MPDHGEDNLRGWGTTGSPDNVSGYVGLHGWDLCRWEKCHVGNESRKLISRQWRLAFNSCTITRMHLCWNCRGLGSNTVVQALHRQIRKHKSSMIFLSKTKMKDQGIWGVRHHMGYSNGFSVAPVGKAGDLSLWWDDLKQVEIMESSKHIIDARCNYIDS